MNELRDKRKNAGQIYYTRMEELRDLFEPCDIGEIILASWDYEQYGIEYDFKKEKNDLYPNLSENIAMQVEYKNLVRDFKLLAESYQQSCERKRENANKRWQNEKVSGTDNDQTDTAYEIAQAFRENGIKSVRELKEYLKQSNVHDDDTKDAIIEAFSKLK